MIWASSYEVGLIFNAGCDVYKNIWCLYKKNGKNEMAKSFFWLKNKAFCVPAACSCEIQLLFSCALQILLNCILLLLHLPKCHVFPNRFHSRCKFERWYDLRQQILQPLNGTKEFQITSHVWFSSKLPPAAAENKTQWGNQKHNVLPTTEGKAEVRLEISTTLDFSALL